MSKQQRNKSGYYDQLKIAYTIIDGILHDIMTGKREKTKITKIIVSVTCNCAVSMNAVKKRIYVFVDANDDVLSIDDGYIMRIQE